MLRKKEAFTDITPIPGFIPRQLALDILHSHSEVITLNPLVLDHKPIPAPRNAASDEYYSTWYEITQRIQFVPGVGNVGSGKITFNGCFHDMPWGLQTHIHAPFNIDMRYKYRIAGNQPGLEPPEPREIGLESLGAPSDGLYLRVDFEFKCNFSMVGFVKSQAKAANKEMVQRIVKKAELLDAGVLQAMMENGKLKTINPNDRSNSYNRASIVPQIPSPIGSPPIGFQQPYTSPYQKPVSPTYSHHSGYAPYGQGGQQTAPVAPVELPSDGYQPSQRQSQPPSAVQELAGDYRQSVSSSDPRWSQGLLSPSLADTRPTSMSSVASSAGNPPCSLTVPQRASFVSELASHKET
ncbi:hypothetical protein AAL_03860 [Moelleriella libera RCEF 2490]|uniref:DUF7053 domain-containing protein n=1 Tax=Moelleriella libera RCEF 2490 TaxID=1081109 RepID=A0A168CI59_9HYPO|nr:hypothetical protein AAL_03860 [Moelleriella libera RCEF 2490]